MVVATNQASLITPPVDEIKKLVALPLPEIKIRECFLKSLFNFCFFKLFCRTFTRALLVRPWKYFYIFECLQYVKVPIRSFFWSVSSCIRTEYTVFGLNTGKYGPEKNSLFGHFHVVLQTLAIKTDYSLTSWLSIDDKSTEFSEKDHVCTNSSSLLQDCKNYIT